MRCSRLLLASLILASSRLMAQGFEGTLSMTLADPQIKTVNWNLKGAMTQASFRVASPQGDTTDMKYIIDNKALTNTVLMPLGAGRGGGQRAQTMAGVKIVNDLKVVAAPAGADSAPAIAAPRKLGTAETIGGIRCENYVLGDADKTRACLTTTLGRFVYPSATMNRGGRGGGVAQALANRADAAGFDRTAMVDSLRATRGGGRGGGDTTAAGGGVRTARGGRGGGAAGDSGAAGGRGGGRGAGGQAFDRAALGGGRGGPGGPGAATPAWVAAIGSTGFPLKVWIPNGAVLLEVTEIKKSAVSPDVFAIPEGYQDMGALGGQAGGRGGRGGGGGGR